jgi:hypothetical protein
MKAVIACGFLVLALGGCASPFANEASTATPSAAIAAPATLTPRPVPTPINTPPNAVGAPSAERTATTRDYWEYFAQVRVDLDDLASRVSECRWEEESCGLNVLLAQLVADRIDLDLEAAGLPEKQAYIGSPPPELRALITKTRQAAQDAKQAALAYGDCEADCMPLYDDVRTKFGSLKATADEWTDQLARFPGKG